MAELQISCLPNGVFQENCYIVADPETGVAVIIDPGEEVELFLEHLSRSGLRLQAIWLTHAHLDHVMGVAGVVSRTGVTEIALHSEDLPLYRGVAEQGAWLGVQAVPGPDPTRDLKPGGTLNLGAHEIGVRHVPGHSPGSVAFIGDGWAISGDALFAGSIGRTDLPGGDMAQLLKSIRSQLLTLPDDTRVLSGHGPETTIGREKVSNPFLAGSQHYAG